jgi:hypothetical protein
MFHGNFGQEALKTNSLISRATTLALIVIDDHDTVTRPSQSGRVISESILSFP